MFSRCTWGCAWPQDWPDTEYSKCSPAQRNLNALDSQAARPPCGPMTLVHGRCQTPALWGCALLTGSHHSWGYQRQHAAGRGHHLGHSRIVIIKGHSYYCWGSFLYVPRLLSLMYRLLCNLFLSTFLLPNKSCCINSIFMFYSSSYQYYIYLHGLYLCTVCTCVVMVTNPLLLGCVYEQWQNLAILVHGEHWTCNYSVLVVDV